MHYTFQVILRPDGEIIYQYLSMQGTLSSASIGIENQIGTSGIEVTFDAPYVHDNLAIRFTSTNIAGWLSVAPTSGSLPAQASVNVDVAVDAAGRLVRVLVDDALQAAGSHAASSMCRVFVGCSPADHPGSSCEERGLLRIRSEHGGGLRILDRIHD